MNPYTIVFVELSKCGGYVEVAGYHHTTAPTPQDAINSYREHCHVPAVGRIGPVMVFEGHIEPVMGITERVLGNTMTVALCGDWLRTRLTV